MRELVGRVKSLGHDRVQKGQTKVARLVHGPWSIFNMCGTIATPETSTSLNFWYLVHSPSLRQQ